MAITDITITTIIIPTWDTTGPCLAR
jgi:hypothetical protein